MTWEQIGTLLGMLIAIEVLHAKLVIPAIVRECRKEWLQDIDIKVDPVEKRVDRLEGRVDRSLECADG